MNQTTLIKMATSVSDLTDLWRINTRAALEGAGLGLAGMTVPVTGAGRAVGGILGGLGGTLHGLGEARDNAARRRAPILNVLADASKVVQGERPVLPAFDRLRMLVRSLVEGGVGAAAGGAAATGLSSALSTKLPLPARLPLMALPLAGGMFGGAHGLDQSMRNYAERKHPTLSRLLGTDKLKFV